MPIARSRLVGDKCPLRCCRLRRVPDAARSLPREVRAAYCGIVEQLLWVSAGTSSAQANGALGPGATVRSSHPDERSPAVSWSKIRANMQEVTGEVSFQDILSSSLQPAPNKQKRMPPN
ncbi:hypothetical protein NDU88_003194 [Pleurodeles waltl]|uniref:Uncharacterized protein n=1 Tax=Pleurodeles waltl TaxID=8319 RepID=A0AAV7TNE3_PLEWA|nr:hypothetical protein NDU88_003194 [Pleurodeles waltl]